jgi:tetratricopeptide (TPR) repeat protein
LKLFDRLLELKAVDADLYRKKAYCHQQLQEYATALQAYLKADLLQADNLWTLKRIAACYRQLKNDEEALTYYRRAEKLDPENYVLSMNIGHCLMDLQRYNEALKSYYKAEFISGESPRTWRPLVWCALLCKKYDQADKYIQKLLAHKPMMVDFLNAGHLEWLQGSALKAIQMYKKGIRLTHTAQSEFFELFEKDLPVLLEQGINRADIPVVRDGLLYQLEE